MRVRQMTSAGDMTFGQGAANFLADTPATVAQVAMTRMNLWTGEWFLDTTEGMPWLTNVVGTGTQGVYDQAILNRITGTPGVSSIAAYQSELSAVTRSLTFSTALNTFYGTTQLTSNGPALPP